MRIHSQRDIRGPSLAVLLWGILWAGEVLGQPVVSRPAAIPESQIAPGPALGSAETGLPEETLDSAWQFALESDQRLQSSDWNLSAAQSSWAAAKAERLPSLTLGGDYLMLSQQPAFALSLPPLPTVAFPFADRDSIGAQVLVKQPLYTSGRISHGIDAAESAVKASQAEVDRTRLDIRMNVAEIYVNVLRATRIVGLAQSKVVSLTAHTRDVTSLFEKGLVSKNDLLSAQVALADARQQSLDAQNSLELAYASYNRALGRPLTQPVRLAELRDGDNLGSVDDLTQRALQQRPELAAIAHQVQALREQAASERAKNLPQVAISGGYVYQRDTYVEPNGAAVLMLGAQWNIMDCGRVRHQADALCEKAEAAVRLYKDSESMIALEVRQRWLELQTARQRVEVARQTTNQADENLRVARDRYQQQVGTNTEVLDAETLRIQAYANFLNSSYQAVLAALRLRRAAGDI